MRLRNLIRPGLPAIGAAVVAAGVTAMASAETLLERGDYLVNTIAACGNCHTPKDSSGREIVGEALSGGFEFDDPGIGHVVGPNITPDPETGIGTWSEAQIVTALRDGKRPDGTIIGPPMPIPVYRQLSDRDAQAIAAYLRSVKPIRHAVARTRYDIPLAAGLRTSRDPCGSAAADGSDCLRRLSRGARRPLRAVPYRPRRTVSRSTWIEPMPADAPWRISPIRGP